MKKMKGSSINYHIPEDIISDIMLQLHVKTLLRCKSVCKLWYKIIDNPKFAYMHSKKIKKSSEDNFLIEAYPFASSTDYGYVPFFYLDESTHNSLYLTRCNNGSRSLSYDSSRHQTAVVGSCNGLICLKDSQKRKYQIMNPLYSITDTYEVDFPSESCFDTPAGFGFDELSHKFKIVCFHGNVRNGKAVRLSVHELGVPSTSSWRELSPSVGSWYVKFLNPDRSSVFADGCIHWRVNIFNIDENFTMYKAVVSFNLTTEEFKINRFGVDMERLLMKCSRADRLLDFNGSLGVVVPEYKHRKHGIRIFVSCGDADNVIENNNEETTKKWINKLCIELSRGYCNRGGILHARRHILMMDKHYKYFSYNTQTGMSTQVSELTRNRDVLKLHQGSLIRPSSLASFCNPVGN